MNVNWKTTAAENGWTEVPEDPRGYEPGVPCLWHEDQERSWPAGDYEGACRDLGIDGATK